MWKTHMEQGFKAMESAQYPLAEQHFFDAIEFARDNFWHQDPRIARSFAYLGRSLVMQKKVDEARSPLRQAVAMAKALKNESPELLLADYLWAYIDIAPDAAERRESALLILKEKLSAAKADALVNELNRLFTVSPKAPEPKPEPKQEPQLDSKSEPEKPPQKDTVTSDLKGAKVGDVPKQNDKPAPEPEDKPVKPDPSDSKAEQKLDEYKINISFFKPVTLDLRELEKARAVAKKDEASQQQGDFPTRYLAWSNTISSGLERSKSDHLSELIAAYVELLALMPETVKLYKPPHKGVADHLSILANIADSIGLYERAGHLYILAAENYEKSLGPSNPKTAEAKLFVAHAYRNLDQYEQADVYFREAMDVLTRLPGVDIQWVNNTVAAFVQMKERAKAEIKLDSILREMSELCTEQRYADAEKLARGAADLLSPLFPADHYLFTLLYRRHGFVLSCCGRMVEADALHHVAEFLDRKLTERHEFNKTMDEHFPEFPLSVAAALYSEDFLKDLAEKRMSRNEQ